MVLLGILMSCTLKRLMNQNKIKELHHAGRLPASGVSLILNIGCTTQALYNQGPWALSNKLQASSCKLDRTMVLGYSRSYENIYNNRALLVPGARVPGDKKQKRNSGKKQNIRNEAAQAGLQGWFNQPKRLQPVASL